MHAVPAPHAGDDEDWCGYPWSGPCSPLFGTDRMASFEGYFVEDEKARGETRKPYLELIHDAEFCRGIAEEMGSRGDHHRRGHRPRGIGAAGSRSGYFSGR